MVKVKEDMIGWKMWEHGVPESRLTVLERSEDYIDINGKAQAMWLCECNCNEHNKIKVRGAYLRSGCIKSCGCIKTEMLLVKNKEKFKGNIYDLSGEYGIGYTSNTNEEFYFDLADYDLIKNYTWFVHVADSGYRELTTNNKEHNGMIIMSNLLGYKYCDHINRNSLDNRRKNFRTASASQNCQNRSLFSNNKSGFTGVYWKKEANKWWAEINVNKSSIYLGQYDNKEDAIKMRLQAEFKYFGEFAPQRHLFKEYGIVTNL